MNTELQRARARAFTAACMMESLSVKLGESSEDEAVAVERLCQQFFPSLTAREHVAQPGGAPT